jgi:hypothetical protein
MFNATTVESDVKRLLHPSVSTVAMRESDKERQVGNAVDEADQPTHCSRIRSQDRQLVSRLRNLIPRSSERNIASRAMASTPSRSLSIHETRRISFESVELDAESAGNGRKQEYEPVRSFESLQDGPGAEVA